MSSLPGCTERIERDVSDTKYHLHVRSIVAFAGVLLLASFVMATPAIAQTAQPRSIVVTTEVLGSIVSRLVDGAASVTTLMTGGSDPHNWQPSARDSQAIFEADLVVANGRGLEEGLIGVIEQASADGVAVFQATDSIEDHDPDESSIDAGGHDGSDHLHASGDPHFWLDPLAMRDVVLALGPVLGEAGVDVDGRAETLAAELEALDVELAQMLSSIPAERRQLVTGHGALGYLAERYDLRVVGTVVPGLSSSDEPSAREVAELADAIRAAGATVVFSDVGTPGSVAQAVADETGAQVVELRVAQLPESGDYADLLRSLVGSIAVALGAESAD